MRAALRARRRDAAQLRWILRTVASSAALTLALLGGSLPASATVVQRDGPPNPLPSFPTGIYPLATLVDIDTDGDFDVVYGGLYGSFRYFENTGTPAEPAFIARTGARNPLHGLELAGSYPRAHPNFADLDDDGDPDLVAGDHYGGFFYFENVGSATDPAFVERTGGASPVASVATNGAAASDLVDLDGDGDFDLVAASSTATFRYFENTGSASSPGFVERTGTANPLDAFAFPAAWPEFVDIDGDQDPDLFTVDRFLENVGSATSPAFVERTGPQHPLLPDSSCSRCDPAFADLDADGDFDAFTRGVSYFQENTGSATNPAFVEHGGPPNPFADTDVGFGAAPSIGDLDADGDLDVVSGIGACFVASPPCTQFAWFENTGSAASPGYQERTGSANPLDGFNVGDYAKPALADLDGDGDLDLLSGSEGGTFHWFENTGSPANPAFLERVGALNPLVAFDVGSYSAPALADLDADGDLDLVAGSAAGSFAWFENVGSASLAAFMERTGSANPLAGLGTGFYGGATTPTLVDIDEDGDVDLFTAGGYTSAFLFFRNTGSASAPAFAQDFTPYAGFDGQPADFPPDNCCGPWPAAHAFADLDGDGDLDALSGLSGGRYSPNGSGHFIFFETLSGEDVFDERTGSANPFDGFALGSGSPPGGPIGTLLADMDGDGDLDLLAGKSDGTFHWLENTGTPTAPAFVERTGSANPLDGFDVGDVSSPRVVDLDGDGDLDVYSSSSSAQPPFVGDVHFFENTGSPTQPAFALRSGSQNPLVALGFASYAAPTFVDIDGDGDLDAFQAAYPETRFFENTGSPTAPDFVERVGARNPLAGLPGPGDFADVDGDGDLDAFLGGGFFENVGSAQHPNFTAAGNPFEEVFGGVDPTENRAFGDLDGDGDVDAVADLGGNSLHYFENITPPIPALPVGWWSVLGAGLGIAWLSRRRR